MSLSSLISEADISNITSRAGDPNLHLLAYPSPNLRALELLLERTNELDASLRHYWHSFEPEPRILGLLKEHTAQSHITQDTKLNLHNSLHSLVGSDARIRRHRKIQYGEDVPFSEEQIPGYVVAVIG
jgi:hypothetical protein